jgi:hypothetical protein
MTSGMLRAGVMLVLGALLAGCSPHAAELVLDTQRVPPATVVARVASNGAGITALTGSGSVSFEGPEMAGSVFFTLALKKPDSLLIRFEGPFGLDAGFLFLSRSQYVMFNRLENQVMMGDPSDAGIRWAIPVDLTVDQILDAFTGSFRFPVGKTPARYTTDDDQFLLSYEHKATTETFWVDPATALVTRYRREGDGNAVIAQTSLPEEQGGLRMPREISLAFPQQGRQLSVYYNELTFNPGSVSFRYTVPRTAQVRSPKP